MFLAFLNSLAAVTFLLATCAFISEHDKGGQNGTEIVIGLMLTALAITNIIALI